MSIETDLDHSIDLDIISLLDTTPIDWIFPTDLRFRGMTIMDVLDDIFFVDNSKEDVPFSGQWSCKENTNDGVSSNFEKLALVGNFTGVRAHVVFVNMHDP